MAAAAFSQAATAEFNWSNVSMGGGGFVSAVIAKVPDQMIEEKHEFASINLADLASDPDHSFKSLKWTVSGNKQLKIEIDGNGVATIKKPTKNWNGSEKVTFTVTDPEGASDKRTVTFKVESVNDIPEFVKPIKDQSIPEKREFAIINLNDIVKDADHKPDQLTWNFDVKPAKGAPKGYTPKLKVTVDGQRMAKIVIPDKYWNGSEEITFRVEDPEMSKNRSGKIVLKTFEVPSSGFFSRIENLCRFSIILANVSGSFFQSQFRISL